jgi:hypothetical protein
MSWQALLWVAGAGLVVYVLHLAALAMERREWIYYRDTRASSSSRTNAFLQVQAMFEPKAEHTVESRRSDAGRKAGDADPGAPPVL